MPVALGGHDALGEVFEGAGPIDGVAGERAIGAQAGEI